MNAPIHYLETTNPLTTAETELAQLSAQIDAATHRQLTLIRMLDEAEVWANQGARSCASWLSWRIDLSPGAARERVRVARALADLPCIDDALREGKLSFSKARALTRVATAANEQDLLNAAFNSTAAQLERICRGLRVANGDGEAKPAEREVRLRGLDDGRARISVTLHADEAARVMELLQTVREGLREETGDAPGLADALMEVVHSFGEGKSEMAPPCEVVVHLEKDLLGEMGATLDDGQRVPAETFRRVACDCALRCTLEEEGGDSPSIDVGRRTRAISPALRRALSRRDGGCRFPGCTCRRYVHAHHIQHWLHGGATDMANLVTVCSVHHELLHEGGWSVRREVDDGAERFVFRDADGRVREARPERAVVDGFDDVKRAVPGDEDPRAGLGWNGERLDYDWVVMALTG